MAIKVKSHDYSVFGNKAVVVADLEFDDKYSPGGDVLDFATAFGMHKVDVALIAPVGGYSFGYDAESKKLKVFTPAPAIRYEEHQIIDAKTGIATLAYPAAWFMNVAEYGANIKMRSTGISGSDLGAGECSLVSQMAAGKRTELFCKTVDLLGGDGAFTGVATNWTLAAGWAYSANAVNKSGDGTGTLAHNAFAAVAGRTYLLTYTISNWTAGTVKPSLGGVNGTAVGADGTYTEVFKATSTDGVAFTPTSTARFTIDSITIQCLDVFVTYVTQAWKEVWDNLVQDEVVSLSSAEATSLSNTPVAVMYVDQTSAPAGALTLLDEDDSVASGEVALFLNRNVEQIKATHSEQNKKDVKITYLKKPASGFLADRVFVNETATNAGSDSYVNTFDYPIVLWGYTGQVPANGQTTKRIIDYAGTPATGQAVIDWFNPGSRGAGAPATGTAVGFKDNHIATGAGIWGTIDEIATVPLETADTKLSALTSVRAVLIGL